MKTQILHMGKRTAWAMAFFSMTTFGFVSCSKDDDTVVNPESQVRVIHAIPGTGSVDFYLNGTKQNATAIAFGDVTGYIASSNGDKTAEFKTGGTTILSAPVSFDGSNYSLFATGRSSNNSLTTLLVKDVLQTPASGKVRLRFVHVSPDAPTVNVVLNDSVWFASKPYKSATDFVEANAGTYTIKLNNSSTGTTAYTQSVTLAAGKNYSLVAEGMVSGTPVIDPALTIDVIDY